MTTIARQLDLTIASLARGFRRALRTAEKLDPMGSPESSEIWKTVAHRQAQFQTLLETAHRFLHQEPAPTPAPEPSPEPAVEPAQELPADLPPEILATHAKIIAVLERPADTDREQSRQAHDLKRLRNLLENQLRAEDRRLAAAI